MGESDTVIREGQRRDPVGELATLEGENLLLTGPPLAGKGDVALDVLARGAGAGRDALLVTNTRSAESFEAAPAGAGVAVVDCSPGETSQPGTHNVASPADLTGISMPVCRFVDRATDPVVALHSLSSLLMYTDDATAFRFVSVVASRVRRAGGLGLFVLDEDSHDRQTVATFAQLFDGRVSVRDGDGGLATRAESVDSLPDDWVDLNRFEH